MAVRKIERMKADPATLRRSSEYWDFWRDGLSCSGLRTFNACPEQFRLQYVEGWVGAESSEPLMFGTAFHSFLEKFHDRKCPVARAKATGPYRAKWLAENPGAGPSARAALEHVMALSEAVWPTYAEAYPADRTRKWIGTEFKFDVPLAIGGFETCLRGIFDGLFEEDGEIWIQETKTRGEIDEFELMDLLPFDLQMIVYAYAAWLRFGKWPAGVVYNVVRRPKHRIKAKEKLIDFARRVEKEIRKNGDHFFKRFKWPLTQARVEVMFHRQVLPMLERIKQWTEGGPHFVNDSNLIMFHRRVPMFNAIVNGDFSGCWRRDPSAKSIVYEEK